MIQKLESAGLGYHVATDETRDRLGKTQDIVFHSNPKKWHKLSRDIYTNRQLVKPGTPFVWHEESFISQLCVKTWQNPEEIKLSAHHMGGRDG